MRTDCSRTQGAHSQDGPGVDVGPGSDIVLRSQGTSLLGLREGK